MFEILSSVFWVGLATVFNLLVWVIAGKVMAVMLGPVGVGVYGLLRQFAQNANVVSTFNGSTTLVQGLASLPAEQRPAFARNVAIIFLGLGVVLGLGILLGASWLAPRLLGKEIPVGVFRWMVIPLIGMSLSAFFLGVLNGYRQLKALVVCQALGPWSALALIYPAAIWIRSGGYWAYSLILGVPYALIGVSGAVVAFRKKWFTHLGGGTSEKSFRRDSRRFFGLSTALLVGGCATTGLQFFINGMVVRKLGLAESGQFWVAWSLSMTYVTVLLSSLGAYYLPSLSGTRDSEVKKQLILTFTRLVLVVMPVLVTLVIVLKAECVRLMFSGDLLPSLKVFRWMLIGDMFKVLSWVWAFPMLAYAEGKTFLVLEVITNLIWGVLACIGFHLFPSIEYLGQLFCVIYLLYSSVTMMYLWFRHSIRLPLVLWFALLRGVAVIVVASVLFWNQSRLSPGRSLIALVLAALNLWISISKSERRGILKKLFPPQGIGSSDAH